MASPEHAPIIWQQKSTFRPRIQTEKFRLCPENLIVQNLAQVCAIGDLQKTEGIGEAPPFDERKLENAANLKKTRAELGYYTVVRYHDGKMKRNTTGVTCARTEMGGSARPPYNLRRIHDTSRDRN